MVIQACKGLQTNTASDDASSDLNNNQVEDDRPFRPTMKPPKSADMLVAYSTVPGILLHQSSFFFITFHFIIISKNSYV